MCLLTYFPPETQPDTNRLMNGAINNSDGHGYAILDPSRDRLIVRRSLDPDTLIERFESDRQKYPHGPAMFHSRFGTGGSNDKENCHPFRVGGDRRTVVAHNGVMRKEVQPRGADTRCDTRIFAETQLPHRNIDKRSGMRRLSRWLGTDKLVILTTNPRYANSAYIVNPQHGHWREGVWYSNYGYLLTGGYGGYTYRYSYDEWDEWLDARITARTEVGSRPGGGYTRSASPCEICGAVYTVSTVTLTCTACFSCQDCYMDCRSECMCHVPHSVTSAGTVPWIGGDPDDTAPMALPPGGETTGTGWLDPAG